MSHVASRRSCQGRPRRCGTSMSSGSPAYPGVPAAGEHRGWRGAIEPGAGPDRARAGRRGRRPDQRAARPARRRRCPRSRRRRRPRLHGRVAAAGHPGDRRGTGARRRGGVVRLPRPRRLGRAEHGRGPRGPRPRRGRPVGAAPGVPPGGPGRLVDGRGGGDPARRAVPRGGRRGGGQRAEPLVLPRDRADAAAAPGRRDPGGARGAGGRVRHPDRPAGLGPVARAPGRRGRPRGARAAARRARRRDRYFPVEHARWLVDAARGRAELWLEPGFGHAEAGATPELLRRIARWADDATRGATPTGKPEVTVRSAKMPP